jgi:hypothetical protein
MSNKGIEESAIYKRTEHYLKEYRAMQARLKILSMEIEALGGSIKLLTDEEPDEYIRGYAFERSNDGMPRGTDISDKVGNLALSWQERYERDKGEQVLTYIEQRQAKQQEYKEIHNLLSILDVAIESLKPIEKEIITRFYIKGMKWADIGRRLSYSVTRCKGIRMDAIWYMSKILNKSDLLVS